MVNTDGGTQQPRALIFGLGKQIPLSVSGRFQPKAVMLPIRRMQVERGAFKRGIQASNVESALLFETVDEIYARVIRQVRPGWEMPRLEVAFAPFASARSTIRFADGVLTVRMADMFQSAPAPIVESLAFILVSKVFRRRVGAVHRQRYRIWLNRGDVLDRLALLQRARSVKRAAPPNGAFYSLDAIFDSVNERFFDGAVEKPALGWSLRRSYSRLGHYDPLHHAIVISGILDAASVDRLIVDYVMFHEMLHIVHPVEMRGSRRVVHTKSFREAEKRFPHFAEARKALKGLLCAPS